MWSGMRVVRLRGRKQSHAFASRLPAACKLQCREFIGLPRIRFRERPVVRIAFGENPPASWVIRSISPRAC
jgi:hypothetical protein